MKDCTKSNAIASGLLQAQPSNAECKRNREIMHSTSCSLHEGGVMSGGKFSMERQGVVVVASEIVK